MLDGVQTFASQTYQHLWLFVFDDVYQQFTYVTHIIQPSTLSGLMLAGKVTLSTGLSIN